MFINGKEIQTPQRNKFHSILKEFESTKQILFGSNFQENSNAEKNIQSFNGKVKNFYMFGKDLQLKQVK